jgi:hypothetical protein
MVQPNFNFETPSANQPTGQAVRSAARHRGSRLDGAISQVHEGVAVAAGIADRERRCI